MMFKVGDWVQDLIWLKTYFVVSKITEVLEDTGDENNIYQVAKLLSCRKDKIKLFQNFIEAVRYERELRKLTDEERTKYTEIIDMLHLSSE